MREPMSAARHHGEESFKPVIPALFPEPSCHADRDSASMLLSDRGLDHCSHFIGFVVGTHIGGGFGVSIPIGGGFLAEARHCPWIGGSFRGNEGGEDEKRKMLK